MKIRQSIAEFLKRRRAYQPGEFRSHRARSVFWLFSGLFVCMIVRATIIQMFPPSKDNLQKIAEKQYEYHLELAPFRGNIYDRQKNYLAISVKRPSLAINPRLFNPDSREIKQLSHLIGIPTQKLKELSGKKSYFAWLKRRVQPHVAEEVDALGVNGIYTINEPTRFYPSGNLAAHLIGSVGSDNSGLMGLERQMNRYLSGEPSRVAPAKDARGKTIYFEAEAAAPARPGDNIHLTIDRSIQEITEQALKDGVKNAEAKSGFAIVSDPHTGKVLAIANYPTFDPNSLERMNLEATRNSALMDIYEPGSIMKAFTISGALEQKKIRMTDQFNCENGSYRVGGVTFRDDHPAGILSVADTIVRSNNICTYKIAERMGKQKLYGVLKDFGFSGSTKGDGLFPSFTSGYVSSSDTWKPIRFANIAFGQGLMVNALEVVQGYGAIANGGNLMKPILVEQIESADGKIVASSSPEVVRKVISPETAKTMRLALSRVVTDAHGTGKAAAAKHYTVAGKTGTAQKVDPKTKAYSNDKRLSSFVGFAPVNDPFLIIYVVIDEPKKKPYFGGLRAGPVFGEIAENALRYLNVAPDLDDTKVAVK